MFGSSFQLHFLLLFPLLSPFQTQQPVAVLFLTQASCQPRAFAFVVASAYRAFPPQLAPSSHSSVCSNSFSERPSLIIITVSLYPLNLVYFFKSIITTEYYILYLFIVYLLECKFHESKDFVCFVHHDVLSAWNNLGHSRNSMNELI